MTAQPLDTRLHALADQLVAFCRCAGLVDWQERRLLELVDTLRGVAFDAGRVERSLWLACQDAITSWKGDE